MRKAFISTAFLLALPAMAQTYARMEFSLQNAQGQAIAGATVTVQNQVGGCGGTASTNATLYPSSTGGTPLTQPLITDGFGHSFAYIASSCYTVIYNSPYTGILTYKDQVPNIPGGGSQPAAPAFTVQFSDSLAAAFQGDPSIVINPSTHTFTAPTLVASGLTPGSSPVCPNGPGGALTNLGCSGGGAGNPASPAFAIQLANNSASAFQADPNILIDPTAHQVILSTAANTAQGLQAPTANAAVTTYSVLAYGAVHDGVNVICGITASSHTLTCPSGTFTSTAVDVGKYLQFYNWTLQPLSVNPPVTTISAFTDSAHVTMTAAALNTNSVIGVWFGTDNTPGFNNCKLAVKASPTQSGTCTIPAGNYIFPTAPYLVQIPSKDDGGYGTPAGGSGAVLACTVSGGGIASCSVSNGGSGYTDSSTLQTNISGGCTAGIQLCGEADVTVATNSSGVVTSATVVLPGFGFTSAPTVAVVALGGDGATATATVTGGTMNVPTLGAGGSGYIASSTLDWYALNGGGSTCTATQTIGGTPIVGHGTVPTNSSGAASGTMTVTVNATSCGATAPIIIFGDFACNSGTLGSPVWGQCANMAPLVPNTIPVSIPMAQGVNWSGGLGGQSNTHGAVLVGPWDFKTVDLNQTAIFGGKWQQSDFTNLTMSSFWNIFANDNANFDNPSGLTMNGAFCLYTGATDLGFTMNNLNCNSYAPWVNGGVWAHRGDFPRGQGGFFDAQSFNNVISHPLNVYGAIPSAIDDLFDTYFWKSGYSQASTDFLETCKFPNPAGLTQRQTSHSLLDVAHIGNGHCLRGVTGGGMRVFTRDNRASGPATSNTLILKGPGFRDIFCCESGGFQVTGWSSEATVALTGTNDPYRNATQQEGGIIIVDLGSSAGHFGNFNGFQWAGSTVNRAIWSISAQGDPTLSAWQNNVGSTVTNAQAAQDPQFETDEINFGSGLCIGCSGRGNEPFDMDSFNAGIKVPAFKILPSSAGVTISVGNFSPLFAAVSTVTPGAWTFSVPVTGSTTINATTGFKVAGAAPSGHYLCGNGTNYVDSATPCAGSAIANIQITTGTTLIAANTCTSVTNSTMTGVATTSAIIPPTPTSDTSAVTGWGAVGGLSFTYTVTANTFSWKVCNSTASPITPGGSITWNIGAR